MNTESRDDGGRSGSSNESSPSGNPALLNGSNQARTVHMLQTKCRIHLENTIEDVRPSIVALSRSHPSFSHLLGAMEEFEADFPAVFENDFHLIGDWDGLQNFIIDLNTSMLILLEIVNAAIYDALDFLDLDLSLDDIPCGNKILVLPAKKEDRIHGLRGARLVGEMTNRIQALAAVLKSFASKTDGLQLRASKQDFQVSTEQSSDSPSRDSSGQFRYEEELDSAAGQIRMLTILPGSVGDPVNCTLEIQLLSDNPVEETLSYVWGNDGATEEIQVNSRVMAVKPNLFEALSGLRHIAQPRRIWVDALCVNQSNSREKSEQVRLMRRIYSTARKAVIWLGARDLSPSEAASWTPIKDLLAQYHKHLAVEGATYSTNYISAQLWLPVLALLMKDLNIVFSHIWWRRMWIVQEAYLPPFSPEIHFKGCVFSFEDLEEAIQICDGVPSRIRPSQRDTKRLSDASGQQTLLEATRDSPAEISSSSEVGDKQQTKAVEVPELLLRFNEIVSLQFSGPLGSSSSSMALENQGLFMDLPKMNHARALMKMRLEERHATIPLPRERYAYALDLLVQFEKSRATDPRDKIFALEGLMPPASGHLLRVDYGRAVESVFKRECARSFNTQGGLRAGIPFFNLLGEQGVNKDVSWILDLGIAPSDASSSENLEILGLPNLGVVFSRSKESPEPGQYLTDIRNLSMEHPGLKFYATPRTLFCGGMRVDLVRYAAKIPTFDSDKPLARFASFLWEVGSELTKPLQSLRDLGDDFWLDKGLASFFSLGIPKDELRRLSDEELSDILNRKIGGKYWFITKRGFVGLCYCAVETDDEISALDQSHVLFILRRASQTAGGASRHRILSRAFILISTRVKADKLLKQGKLAVAQYQII